MARSIRQNIDNNAYIIISQDHYNALGIVRSLGEAKLSVFLIVESGLKSFVSKSKYICKTYYLNSIYSKIIDIVCGASEHFNKVFLFPLSDKSACFIDENYCNFPTNVVLPHMNGEMARFQNKFFLKEYACSMGLNVPRGTVLDLLNFNFNFAWDIFPAIIKPLVSVEGKKTDIRTAYDKDNLFEAIRYFIDEGYERALIEEFINGKDEHMVEVMGYCSNGKPFLSGIISKIREYPFFNGSTSYARVVEEHDGIDKTAISKFFENSHFFGLFDMEFKYANGKCYFIECNFRNGAPSYGLTLYNRNIPIGWINSVCEQQLKCKKHNLFNKKEVFMCEQNDVLNALKRHVCFFKWVWQYLTCKKVFFRFSDVRPCITYYKDFVKNHFSKKEES